MKRTPIKRKTPLRSTPKRRRSPTKVPLSRAERPPSQVCSVRGCLVTHVPIVVSDVERYCKKHGTKKADDATREYCRAIYHRCVACGDQDRGVQWAHVHTRGMRFVRWDRDNWVGLCANCHYAYTQSTARWVLFVERRWPGLYIAVVHRELYADSIGGEVDVAEVIRRSRAQLDWRMPDPPDDWLTTQRAARSDEPPDLALEEGLSSGPR